MTLSDSFIVLREGLLSRLTGSDPAHTLNPPTASSGLISGDPAAELKRALQSVMSVAFDQNAQLVDYGFLSNSAEFAAYCDCVAGLRTYDPSSLTSREARLAFWINLYNAMVIHAVIELGIKRSVAERWAGLDFFRKAAYLIDERRMSCDDIEHGILRANRGHPFLPGPQFTSTDPRCQWMIEPMDLRIHFALNCASFACPPIFVYAADLLDQQLDMAARSYLVSEVSIELESKTILLSEIFRWFAADFGKKAGVIDILLTHLPEGEKRDWLSQHQEQIKFRYTPYDWKLNSKV